MQRRRGRTRIFPGNHADTDYCAERDEKQKGEHKVLEALSIRHSLTQRPTIRTRKHFIAHLLPAAMTFDYGHRL